MAARDSFEDIARYYDPIMSHVNYDRWYYITTALARLAPERFVHLDAACGTGTLLKRLRKDGWHSCGVDLSLSMLRTGRKGGLKAVTAVADLHALPFRGGAHYITCLFDSLNFVLTTKGVRRVIQEFCDALAPGGVLYFDVVTERMVTQHFDGQSWTEKNGRFSTTWSSVYHRATATAETRIRVSNGPECVVRERVYPASLLVEAMEHAGLTVLGQFDAETWRPVNKRSLRIDSVAIKSPTPDQVRHFTSAKREIQAWLPS